jgi:hypothetical protein
MIKANLRLVVKIAHDYSNLGRSPRGRSRSYGATQFNRGFSYGQRRELNAMSRLTSSEPAVPYLVRIWLIDSIEGLTTDQEPSVSHVSALIADIPMKNGAIANRPMPS